MFSRPKSQCGKKRHFDALVIGGGIAGLIYILELLKCSPQAKVALIVKKNLSESNSFYAQGGIAAVTSGYDTIESHVEDTLAAGDGLCYKKAVEEILSRGADAVQTLIAYGVGFTKSTNSTEQPYDLTQEGGHSARRILHSGDHTGQQIIGALTEAIKELPQLEIFEYHTAISLITQDEVHLPGSCKEVIGAYILDEQKGVIDTYLSKVVVLATGGAGKVYRYTSNPETATGDGIAMAYRVGARIGNMEFYQFHPTLLYHQKINNFLISEALRGEGAYLLNADTKERFMSRYAPKQMELATRDVVARAIFTEMEKSKNNFVYLDIRHQPREYLASRFPTIFNTLVSLGIDMSTDLIPVVPAAHYLCGGVLTDIAGHTDLRRLYAIGETAFTGLHGANRLASNSLLEGVVMAKLAAESSKEILEQPFNPHHVKDWDSQHVTDLRRASQINAHWRGLRGEMTSYAGIVRTEAGLEDLLNLINARLEMIEHYYWQHTITRDVIELRNIVLIAKMIVTSALMRKESRGGHYREDYPKKNDAFGSIILRAEEAFQNIKID